MGAKHDIFRRRIPGRTSSELRTQPVPPSPRQTSKFDLFFRRKFRGRGRRVRRRGPHLQGQVERLEREGAVNDTRSSERSVILWSSAWCLSAECRITKGCGTEFHILNEILLINMAGKSYLNGRRLSIIDLLVLTSSDQLLFILKIAYTLFTKPATLIRRSTVQNLPSCSVSVLWKKPYLATWGVLRDFQRHWSHIRNTSFHL